MASAIQETVCDSSRCYNSLFNLDFGLLQEHRRHGKYCDLFLQSTLEDSKEIIPCHKIVMATVSPFFKSVLDRKDSRSRRSLYMETIGYKTLEAIIDYIYSGGVIKLNSESAFETFNAAKELKLLELETACLDYIKSLVSIPQVIRILDFAKINSCEELEKVCLELILKNLSEVKSYGFYLLSSDNIKLLVQQHIQCEFPATEDVLKAVTDWFVVNKREKSAISVFLDIPWANIDPTVLRQFVLAESALTEAIMSVRNSYLKELQDLEKESQIAPEKERRAEKRSASTPQPDSEGDENDQKSSSVPSSSARHSKRPRLSPPSDGLSKMKATASKVAFPVPVPGGATIRLSTDAHVPTIRKATLYFVARTGKRPTDNKLLAMDLDTKYIQRVGAYPYSRNGYHLFNHDAKIDSLKSMAVGRRTHLAKVYDAKNNRWNNAAPNFATSRPEFGAVTFANYLYMIGGFSWRYKPIDDVLRLNLSQSRQRKWESVRKMSVTRSHCGTCVIDGKIYAIGGYSGRAKSAVIAVESYDPQINKWTNKSPMPDGRAGLAVAAVGTCIYAIGGGRDSYFGETYLKNKLNTLDIYDTQKDKWRPGIPMNKKRQYFSAAVCNNYIYVFGGDSDDCPTMERFNIENQVWEDMGNLPAEGMYRSVALYLQERRGSQK